MLFSLIASTLAGQASQVVTTYPCQRLGWAWRNVWVTCSIDARVPGANAVPTATSVGSDANAPNYNAGFHYAGTSPHDATKIDILQAQTGATVGGVFTNAGFFAPPFADANFGLKAATYSDATRAGTLCAAIGNAPAGINGIRTACRRAIDLYGSLLELCRNPVRARTPLAAPGVAPSGAPHTSSVFYGTTNIWTQAAPYAEMVPHVGNVQILSMFAHQCITPQGKVLSPVNSCPGLVGWFSVASQACNVNNAFGGSGAIVSTPANIVKVPAAIDFAGNKFGGSAAATPAMICGATVDATNWHLNGAAFHRSACRRAIDQFTRTAARCATQATNFEPAQKTLQALGVHWGLVAPEDCK